MQVSLFAELFQEMLQRDFGESILQAILMLPSGQAEDKKRQRTDDNGPSQKKIKIEPIVEPKQEEKPAEVATAPTSGETAMEVSKEENKEENKTETKEETKEEAKEEIETKPNAEEVMFIVILQRYSMLTRARRLQQLLQSKLLNRPLSQSKHRQPM